MHLLHFPLALLSLVPSHTIDTYFAFKRRARSIQQIWFVTTLPVHLDRIQQRFYMQRLQYSCRTSDSN
ncbi:hypothetical protein BcDW1_6348 [Botrytis cinerea BcDW1]|uniref:Secreted protein n=1 Tax=Botryotinia fuckeliana (strain BcDW1) TaxID=1290391 RepID=M7TUL1_BOTF1|nr:hypothetical protein BcDW1_6348 [Botrytis cinerea BcDW1]